MLRTPLTDAVNECSRGGAAASVRCVERVPDDGSALQSARRSWKNVSPLDLGAGRELRDLSWREAGASSGSPSR